MAINTYVGFKILDKLSDKGQSVIEFNNSSIEVILPSEESIKPSDTIGDISSDIDINIDVSTDNLDYSISVTPEDSLHKELCTLYDKLIVSGLDTKDIDRELSNILLVKLTGIEVTPEQRMILFNSLNRTVPAGVDVIDYYCSLAEYTHVNHCSDEHSLTPNGITCAGLQQVAKDFKLESFSEFVTRKALETGSLTMVDSIQRIMCSDFTLSDCLAELDAIYTLCTIPTDVSEDLWNELFRNLLTTTNEYENVCYVYYDLALLVHRLTCEYPHYINQFGVTECVTTMQYKLT